MFIIMFGANTDWAWCIVLREKIIHDLFKNKSQWMDVWLNTNYGGYMIYSNNFVSKYRNILKILPHADPWEECSGWNLSVLWITSNPCIWILRGGWSFYINLYSSISTINPYKYTSNFLLKSPTLQLWLCGVSS